jgi:hypothetical protein
MCATAGRLGLCHLFALFAVAGAPQRAPSARDLLRCGNVLRRRYSVAPNRCLCSLGVSRWRPVRGELWAARYLLRNKFDHAFKSLT